MKKLIVLIVTGTVLVACGSKGSHSEHGGHSNHGQASADARNYADSVNAGIISADTLKRSVPRVSMDFIGDNHVHMVYGSPGVRGRQIWGGLVAYDEVWVAGAHQATSVEFGKDVVVDGKDIPAGKYAFFLIPGKETWIAILNKNWDQHLADEYKETEDVVRVTVSPETTETTTQRLTYIVRPITADEGEIIFEWEKIRVRLPFRNR